MRHTARHLIGVFKMYGKCYLQTIAFFLKAYHNLKYMQ